MIAECQCVVKTFRCVFGGHYREEEGEVMLALCFILHGILSLSREILNVRGVELLQHQYIKKLYMLELHDHFYFPVFVQCAAAKTTAQLHAALFIGTASIRRSL